MYFLGKFSYVFLLSFFSHDWLKFLPIILPVLLSVAFFTVMERKVLASMQRRRGPNKIGLFGLLQAVADALKLLSKEMVIPFSVNTFIFIMSPLFTFFISYVSWVVIPFDLNLVISDLNLGILFIFALSSLGVYGIIMSGWSSNSKYAFLGGLRSAAQLISYEVSIGIVIMPVLLLSQSTNLTSIILSQNNMIYIIPLIITCMLFFISVLAETNRVPFDLPEAESELVSGYNVEYSSVGFTLFFLAEYSNILLMSCLITILFLGGWLSIQNTFLNQIIPCWIILVIKIIIIMFLFVWVRATLPRYRYDQLMYLGWKVVLPASLFVLFLSMVLFSLFNI